MPKVSAIQTGFNTGELSPLLYGRPDFAKYKNALKTCLNWIPLVQGPIIRRPGTHFVAEVQDSTRKTRLKRFEFSTTQAYILEFGHNNIRVYKDHGVVVDGASVPVDIVTTYTEDEVAALKFAQSADTLYIAHPDHAPAKLTRSSHISWTLSTISFIDGPYMVANSTATTLSASATTGAVTVTASAVTGINNDTGFQATDIGRALRIRTTGAKWGWGTITAVADTLHCTLTVVEALGATTATANWRIGLWGTAGGQPGAVAFFEDRLIWGGASGSPQTFAGSRTGIYENHGPTAYDTSATVASDNGYTFTLSSGLVQNIRWMTDDEKGLMIGTISGEWIVRPSSTGEALSPTNVNAKQATRYGSANIQAVNAGKAAIFVQRSGRKVREFAYDYASDGFRAPNMTILSEHVTRGGVSAMTYQQEPHTILWMVRADGCLVGFTYDREQNEFGWHRHFLGGVSDADGTEAIVESVDVIPSTDGSYDELWLVVKRYINGVSRRYVEYMNKFWDEEDDISSDAKFLDSALTYDGSPSTTTATVSGLDHLVGQVVDVWGDGVAQTSKTVSAGGSITLDVEALIVHVGLGYNSDAEMLRQEAGAADGTAQGKIQRTHKLKARFLETTGVSVGRDFTTMDPVIFREGSDNLGDPVPLFSGDKHLPFEGTYTSDNYACFRVRSGPAMIQSVMPSLNTQDAS